ncbi:MAG: hypothetical protein WB508_02095 [Aeromicrobium sp.]|uniref:PspA-associated protein PspAB n=1 Tax=Aeromicrobium sp. TaxID=1871063 RepID=UPI003C6586FC
MKIWDALLGRSTPPAADLDALFAVPQASLSLQAQGFTPTGQGAVCYRRAEGGAFVSTESQIEQLIAMSGSTIEKIDDSYGFRWLSVQQTSADVSGLVTDLHAANTSLADAGFGQSLLCSTMGFTSPDGRTLALVYLFKRGTFYPFVPSDGQHRDNALELQVRGIVDQDIAIEADLSRWLAIWGAPGL